MSKSVEEVRRAAFESYVTSDAGGYLPEHLERDANGDYTIVWEYWGVWNAAMDAVEIHLPERDAKGSGSPDSEMGASLEQYEAVAYNFALADCRAAIEQTGLGLRIK